MEFQLDKKTMRSFLGMINYLNRYSALSAHLATPLSALTHQAMGYKPGKVHFENFNRLKVEISNMKALPYFDVNAETNPTDGCFQEGTWCMPNLEGESHVMLQGLLQRLNRITRIWRERHLELSGEWKSSTTFCMERNSHWKLTRSHL